MDPIEGAYTKLLNYLEKENYKGYDLYDTLNSRLPFHWLGKMGPLLAIQFQKRNPVNIRPLIGIKKEINPKAFGLFLQAFSIGYRKTSDEKYLVKARYFFNWLKDNSSRGYTGKGWGYNFPWLSSIKYLPAYTPTAVVTGFVCRGIYKYYEVTKDAQAASLLVEAAEFVLDSLPVFSDQTGICISYSPVVKDACYNASLLGAEILARAYSINGNEDLRKMAVKACDFVISRQKEDGRWNYSMDLETGEERSQIDFHQGYVLESLYEIKNLCGLDLRQIDQAMRKGLEFYFAEQFFKDGRSRWRWPRNWPVDIHNQAQGIITFSRLKEYGEDYSSFAKTIANWTIGKMQNRNGYFYYQVHPNYKIRIPYIRWSQAWMLLALLTLDINPET